MGERRTWKSPVAQSKVEKAFQTILHKQMEAESLLLRLEEKLSSSATPERLEKLAKIRENSLIIRKELESLKFLLMTESFSGDGEEVTREDLKEVEAAVENRCVRLFELLERSEANLLAKSSNES